MRIWPSLLLISLIGCTIGDGPDPRITKVKPLPDASGRADSLTEASIIAQYDSVRTRMDEQGDTLQRVEFFRDAAQAFLGLNPPRWGAALNCYGAIASLTHRTQHADTALRYAIIADRLYRERQADLGEYEGATTFRFMALAFCDARRFDAARRYATLALDHANQQRDPVLLGKAKDVLADVYSRSGEYEKAVELEKEYLHVLKGQLDTARMTELAIRRRMDDAYSVLAEAYKQLNEFDSAFLYMREACANANSRPELVRQAAVNDLNIGISHAYMAGRYDSAVYYLERAEERMPDDPGAQRDLVQGRSWRAIGYVIAGRLDDALALAREELDREFKYFSAQPVIDWHRTDVQLLQMLDGYACVFEEAYHQRGDVSDAAVACRLSDDVMKGHVITHTDADPASLISASMFRTWHMNRYISFLHRCCSSEVSATKLTALFETKRSDQLRAQLQGVEELGLGGHHVRAYRKLVNERALLAESGTDEAIISRIAKLDASIDSVRNLVAGFTSSSANIDGDALLASVRAAIDDSTLVLNYSWADDVNGAFLQTLAVTRSGHVFEVEPLRPVIDSLVLAKVVAVRTGAPDSDDGSLLALLMPEGMDLARYSRVIIIPDGPLNALPFESLVHARVGGSRKLLLEQHQVSYEYCLTFLGKKETDDELGELFACAPSFSNVDTGWTALSEAGSMKEAARAYLRAGVGPLTQNVHEVEEVMELFPGDALTGAEVAEALLRERMSGRSILHFATHAVCSTKRPELSGILLSPVSDANGTRGVVDSVSAYKDDGVLHAYEIQSMDLPADLVVLSACETAIGKQRMGEGAMSIARAFKYAGAKSIVSSLWKVDDLATKQIMVKFYELLAEGKGKADALAESKRWYRREFPNEPPSKWAAFILIGDNEPVHLKKRSPVQPWLIGGALAAVIAAIAARRRRSRRAA